ncbi:MAG: trypsin-like peptidase domain-containing protein, partial [Pirellulales bacterium]|nr:trypsin-like peptidase domain-containing protein [Pirellulales bacterium]
MRILIYSSITILLAATFCAPAWAGRSPAAQIHPAVVRIIVPERNGASLGSGTLVAVNERHGLVLTNWHVVRDGNGMVTVVFPDGFHSGATVLKVDRDWDLAALVIWRPHVSPVRLAGTIPRKGEPLTIAGYGSGKYRMVTGRCTEYVSPGRNLPFEMLELSAGARQGDSGGPILNQRGELAGVLFGAAWGRTTGSHCGRVRNFLGPIMGDFNDLPDSRTMIAANTTADANRAQNGFQP